MPASAGALRMRWDAPPRLSRADAAISAALVGLAFAYFSLTWGRTLDLRDEGYLLNQAARVASGALPHRDFIDIYGPFGHLLSGAALWASGGEIIGVRVALALLKCVAVLLGYLMARAFTPRSFAILGALVGIAAWGRFSANLNTPYAATLTLVLSLACTYAVTLGLQRSSRRALLFAGVLAGLAVLGKQSLGLTMGYGLGLAIWGAWLLTESKPRGSARHVIGSVSLWWLAAVVMPVPLLGFLEPKDYVLHFMPMHLAMLALGLYVIARPRCASPLGVIPARLLPFGLGVGAVLLPTLLAYLAWGSLDQLVFDMFVLPRFYQNYYEGIWLPSLSVGVFAAGFIALSNGALRLLRGHSRSGSAIAALGVIAMGLGRFAISADVGDPYSLRGLALIHLRVEGLELAGLELAALVLVLPIMVRKSDGAEQKRAIATLPLLFFAFMLAFQAFPRAGSNLWLLHGVLAPLLALVLHLWTRSWEGIPGSGARRAMAILVASTIPAWLAAPLVVEVLSLSATETRALALPYTHGIALAPREIRRGEIAQVEQLVAYLDQLEPRDAPIFLLSNQEMLRYFTGRPHLFPDQAFYLFLAGWGMLSDALRPEFDSPEMIETLRGTPNAILVWHRDVTADNLREAVPRIAAEVDDSYEITAEIGSFRVLRRRPGR